ncbi:GAF domain-containing protein [Hoeflea sp. AS60]|uniref:GAF domain-containing protein n=1 Tax=Hoeflea sp. AS60 TaxID=3135780 RepID=UPI00316FBA0D
MSNIAKAFADKDQPLATFKAVERHVQETIGAKLFTMSVFNPSDGSASRIYTNMPDAYPVYGEKPMVPNTWTAKVLDRHEIFVANSIEEIAEVFPDHELILSLGYESCVNIPVVIGGNVIGTLNCLDVAGHYTPQRVADAELLKPHGAIALLLHAFQTS